MSRRITLLTDYKNIFYCPHKNTNISTDLEKLSTYFAELDYDLQIKRFCDIDFRGESYRDEIVLYQSSQDADLHYKGYIEDIMLGLKLQGARIIPNFHLFRAHHNKVFMEILRDLTSNDSVRVINSKAYGTYEDFEADLDKIAFPVVLKAAAGDSGKQVALARDAKEAKRIVRRLSLSVTLQDIQLHLSKHLTTRGWRPDSLHRKKFIVQEFIPGLDHDWKTLVFGDKYFVSVRPTRKNDFRASGSPGTRTYPKELPDGLLDYLETVFGAFNAPYASIDVLWDGDKFYLGEFQFIRFGTGALIRNTHHWRRIDDKWTRIDGQCEWEKELATCIAKFVENKKETINVPT